MAVVELVVTAFSALIVGVGLYLKLSLEAYAWLLEGYKTGELVGAYCILCSNNIVSIFVLSCRQVDEGIPQSAHEYSSRPDR